MMSFEKCLDDFVSNCNKDLIFSRRDFLKSILSGIGFFSLASFCVDESYAQLREWSMPSNNNLLKWLKQPVKETLNNTFGVSYNVDDSNFDNVIFQSVVRGDYRMPCAILFYLDSELPFKGLKIYSRYNAAFIRAINYNYPNVKICGYDVDKIEGSYSFKRDRISELYDVKQIPFIHLYDKDVDNNIFLREKMHIGFASLSNLKDNILKYKDFFNETIS
jgi:hypothetical protein